MNKLTLRREGSFLLTPFGKNHCGITRFRGQKLLVKYNLVCECRVNLDKRGFLFDQLTIQNFFNDIQRSSLSCEQLVIRCTEDLVKAIRDENRECYIDSMELTLSPEPHAASMTYTWRA